jgi:ElaB/YqjD/DUF883 family membrane-anchored ribosome-binding protein
MCNYLFNIGNVFGAPAIIRDILDKLTPAHEEKRKDNKEALDNLSEVQVNEDGEVEIPKELVIGKAKDFFGDKIYEDVPDLLDQAEELLQGTGDKTGDSRSTTGSADLVDDSLKKMADTLKATVEQHVAPAMDDYAPKKAAKNRITNTVNREIERDFQRISDDYRQGERILQAELDKRRKEANTEEEVKRADAEFDQRMNDLIALAMDAAKQKIQETVEEKPLEVVEHLERNKQEAAKREAEEETRSRLRGFSRTIPSFIMAYGDENLTLANFDDYTEDDVFLDVTGITEDDFRLLRDGGERRDPRTGEMVQVPGHFFDETVFNDSIREFLRKKEELSNYFDESQTEDIFDYIPPQKTNQIFTPKRVVKMMVDELEKENPGCFDDPNKTFADLYMKSGLYITEIVKRLYNSPAMKSALPDDGERIRHILSRQVYGMAPTRIIYLIATNYILGFDEELKKETHNFVEADAAEAAKNGTLQALVDQHFG